MRLLFSLTTFICLSTYAFLAHCENLNRLDYNFLLSPRTYHKNRNHGRHIFKKFIGKNRRKPKELQGEPGPQGIQGPEGPRGYQGPPGPQYDVFAIAYSELEQEANRSLYNIIFDFDHLASGITHPVEKHYDQFEVKSAGLYMIGWTMTVNSDVVGLVEVRVVDSELETPFPPAPICSKAITYPGANEVISGQMLVPLAAQTKIQLQVIHNMKSMSIINPSIYMTQVNALPDDWVYKKIKI